MALRQRLGAARPIRKPQTRVAPFRNLPLNFAEIAKRVPVLSAFRQLPQITALRRDLAQNPTKLLAAETLAYFVVLTEFVTRNASSRTKYKAARSGFYNLQRRKVAIEDPIALELAIELRQQHTVQGIRRLQTQLFTAYPVAAGMCSIHSIKAIDEGDFAVMPYAHWKDLLPLFVVIYPDQISIDKVSKRRSIEDRDEKDVADLLRKRLINFAGRTPQSMLTAVQRSLTLFMDARRVYQAQREAALRAADAT